MSQSFDLGLLLDLELVVREEGRASGEKLFDRSAGDDATLVDLDEVVGDGLDKGEVMSLRSEGQKSG